MAEHKRKLTPEEWHATDGERHRRAREERLRHDGARTPGENLEEGIALARHAQAFAGIAVPATDS